MGRLGRSEDGRLSWLAHVRGLRLPCKQQRVRVGIGGVEDDPAHKAQKGKGDEGGVDVPAR
jgi:hypothetical protein